jgi:hypothetical protein
VTENPRTLKLAPWPEQRSRWPTSGRHVLAHHDDDEMVVYQALSLETAGLVVDRQRFDVPGFKLTRMTWVKPSFLWMMYRSDWARKDEGQRRILAVWLRRSAFESLLARAIVTPFDPARHRDEASWEASIARSDVRIQWDPDRTPRGGPDGTRRAIQVGLAGAALRDYATTLVLEVQDITPFVEEQRELLADPRGLLIPVQTVMPIVDPLARQRAEVERLG